MTLLSIPAGVAQSLDMWSSADIPAAALWIKDLVLWGTLEPAAAYALSRRLADARSNAEALAAEYYAQRATKRLAIRLIHWRFVHGQQVWLREWR